MEFDWHSNSVPPEQRPKSLPAQLCVQSATVLEFCKMVGWLVGSSGNRLIGCVGVRRWLSSGTIRHIPEGHSKNAKISILKIRSAKQYTRHNFAP